MMQVHYLLFSQEQYYSIKMECSKSLSEQERVDLIFKEAPKKSLSELSRDDFQYVQLVPTTNPPLKVKTIDDIFRKLHRKWGSHYTIINFFLSFVLYPLAFLSYLRLPPKLEQINRQLQNYIAAQTPTDFKGLYRLLKQRKQMVERQGKKCPDEFDRTLLLAREMVKGGDFNAICKRELSKKDAVTLPGGYFEGGKFVPVMYCLGTQSHDKTRTVEIYFLSPPYTKVICAPISNEKLLSNLPSLLNGEGSEFLSKAHATLESGGPEENKVGNLQVERAESIEGELLKIFNHQVDQIQLLVQMIDEETYLSGEAHAGDSEHLGLLEDQLKELLELQYEANKSSIEDSTDGEGDDIDASGPRSDHENIETESDALLNPSDSSHEDSLFREEDPNGSAFSPSRVELNDPEGVREDALDDPGESEGEVEFGRGMGFLHRENNYSERIDSFSEVDDSVSYSDRGEKDKGKEELVSKNKSVDDKFIIGLEKELKECPPVAPTFLSSDLSKQTLMKQIGTDNDSQKIEAAGLFLSTSEGKSLLERYQNGDPYLDRESIQKIEFSLRYSTYEQEVQSNGRNANLLFQFSRYSSFPEGFKRKLLINEYRMGMILQKEQIQAIQERQGSKSSKEEQIVQIMPVVAEILIEQKEFPMMVVPEGSIKLFEKFGPKAKRLTIDQRQAHLPEYPCRIYAQLLEAFKAHHYFVLTPDQLSAVPTIIHALREERKKLLERQESDESSLYELEKALFYWRKIQHLFDSQGRQPKGIELVLFPRNQGFSEGKIMADIREARNRFSVYEKKESYWDLENKNVVCFYLRFDAAVHEILGDLLQGALPKEGRAINQCLARRREMLIQKGVALLSEHGIDATWNEQYLPVLLDYKGRGDEFEQTVKQLKQEGCNQEEILRGAFFQILIEDMFHSDKTSGKKRMQEAINLLEERMIEGFVQDWINQFGKTGGDLSQLVKDNLDQAIQSKKSFSELMIQAINEGKISVTCPSWGDTFRKWQGDISSETLKNISKRDETTRMKEFKQEIKKIRTFREEWEDKKHLPFLTGLNRLAMAHQKLDDIAQS